MRGVEPRPSIGAAGFEPATSGTQSRCASRLRHAPRESAAARVPVTEYGRAARLSGEAPGAFVDIRRSLLKSAGGAPTIRRDKQPTRLPDNGKPSARVGRKATELSKSAGLPK